MTEVDVLEDLIDRLEQTAARLRGGELEPTEAAGLVEECARLAGDAATELDRRVRAAADAPAPAPGAGRAAGVNEYPEDLRQQVEDYLGALRFADPDTQGADGLQEAMRYSLLAGGKRIRPVLALATARALGEEPASVLPLAAARRADPHLLADPRRPAGDGRRRPAPRAPDLPSRLRRGRRDPRRRRSLRGGVPAPADDSAGRPGGDPRRRERAGRRDGRERDGRRAVSRRDRSRSGAAQPGCATSTS